MSRQQTRLSALYFEKVSPRLLSITSVVVVVLTIVGVRSYVAWQRGDDFRILGVGVMRRFPCADYPVPHSGYGTIQAFAVIDSAALNAQSNQGRAVRTLIDAVFDRELPDIRCGDPLRRRVTEAEWMFRAGKKPPITEQTLSDAANDVMRTSGAPDWARTSVSELHFIRMALRDLLPRFVGTVDSELQLSDKMTPVEAVFVVMTLGKGMVLEPDDFLNGPDGYVARAHERQSSAPPAGAVLRARVTTGAILDLANGRAFDDQHGLAATSARRLLDQLRFPR